MKYRKLPHGNEQISVIGMGSAYIGENVETTIVDTVKEALKNGVNYFDLGAGYSSTFPAFGKAFKGIRDKVYLQVHFGAEYTTGEYGWTTNLETIKSSVKWQLEALQTEYIDFGFIHCMDEDEDFEAYVKNGVLNYVLSLKEQGIIHHIGLSSHNPKMVNKLLDLGIIDIVMFSINPAYDYQHGEYSRGTNQEREDLYKRCEKEGIGITVMKPFCGGQLLDPKKSPFGYALNIHQCIQYALDKPSVLCVLPGFNSVKEVQEVMEFFEQESIDYSIISNSMPAQTIGKCVYCKHCHPCPKGLDIALINKYYDLSRIGDEMAHVHYLNLAKHASDCIQCSHCNKRCPFMVNQMERMKEIQEYFKV